MLPRFLSQLLLICQLEVYRTFATRKGLVNLVTFAVVWYFILFYPLRFAAELLAQGKTLMQGTGFFEFMGLNALQQWTIPEYGVFWHFALLLFPMLSISLAADQTCSDRGRGTLRFIVLRCNRASLFFGRFLGAILIQSVFIGATASTVFLLVLFRDSTLFPQALSGFSVIVVNITLAILPFTAMMAVLSVQVKTVRSATVWAILIWTFSALIIDGLAHYFPILTFLNFLIPGYQLADLAQLNGWRTLQLAYIPLLQSLVLLGIGHWIMARQAL